MRSSGQSRKVLLKSMVCQATPMASCVAKEVKLSTFCQVEKLTIIVYCLSNGIADAKYRWTNWRVLQHSDNFTLRHRHHALREVQWLSWNFDHWIRSCKACMFERVHNPCRQTQTTYRMSFHRKAYFSHASGSELLRCTTPKAEFETACWFLLAAAVRQFDFIML